MSSDRDSSSSLDNLWDPEPQGKAEEIPPTLDPRGLRRAPSAPDEDRDTLEPPQPQPDYVRDMMALGELEDPSGDELARRTRPGRPDDDLRALGLVLADEDELLLSGERSPARSAQIAAPAGGSMMRSAGLRALGPSRGAPVIAGAPAPRAPSIPPAPAESDPLALFDALDDLDPGPAVIVGTPAGRVTPALGRAAARSTPRTPGQRARSPSAGGIRLLKTIPEPQQDVGDRVTPLAIEPAPSSMDDSVREMLGRFTAGNFTGALVLAEGLLVSDPAHTIARQTADRCRAQLGEKYLSSLGDRSAIPRVVISQEEMRWLTLDHRAGFLLSFIDGSTTIGEVLDGSAMSELEALRIMFELRQQGAIEIQEPPRRARRK